jgi:hypothetical protein
MMQDAGLVGWGTTFTMITQSSFNVHVNGRRGAEGPPAPEVVVPVLPLEPVVIV